MRYSQDFGFEAVFQDPTQFCALYPAPAKKTKEINKEFPPISQNYFQGFQGFTRL